MTIFDFISDVLFTKKKSLSSVDEESDFSPFLLNRWISMYSPAQALISNTVNKYLSSFTNKSDLYSFFIAVFDKCPSKKIQYYKKIKSENNATNNENILLLAKNKELSTREIKEYIEALTSL